MTLCDMFRHCPNGIYALCEARDYIDSCKCRDKIVSEVLKREQIEKADRLGKPIIKYKDSWEQYPV